MVGYPMGGYPMGGYPMDGYPMSGYPMDGCPVVGYPMGGYPMGGCLKVEVRYSGNPLKRVVSLHAEYPMGLRSRCTWARGAHERLAPTAVSARQILETRAPPS